MKKKNLSNHYSCGIKHVVTFDDIMNGLVEDDMPKYHLVKDKYLQSEKNGRWYKTKMEVESLPLSYCQVEWNPDELHFINSANVKNLKYCWIKENHWMKDSVLLIDYDGNMEIQEGRSGDYLTDYNNVDIMIWDRDILKFIAYVKKFSDYDLTDIRQTFIDQVIWLQENEPMFAPTKGDAGEWFDAAIKEYSE